MSVAPFTAALISFKTILDYLLPEDWFNASILRILFAGICSLCIGLSLHVLGQRYTADAAETQAPGRAAPADGPTTRRVLDDAVRGVLAEFRHVPHGDSELAGWSQYLNDHLVPPTAVGTSYGLRMVASFDVRDSRISRHQLVQSLLALQKPGGGWAASTQRDRGRPEITAWVLAAVIRTGVADETRAALVRVLEDMLDVQDDPVGMDRTTVMAAAISTLAEVAPTSPMLPRLARRLLDGARREEHSPTPQMYWGESSHSSTKSAAHTARAVIALHRAHAAGVLAEGALFENAARSGVTWLCNKDLNLHTTDEQLRRPIGDGTVDALVIGHFTAAWVARALMLPGMPTCEETLLKAVREILRNREGGTWRWHDDTRPIWMTYQGATVLRDYALRNSTCL